MISASDPSIQELLRVWHESGRADYERNFKVLNYDQDMAKVAKDRRKYIALDRRGSGVYLVDRETDVVWNIKAYGVPKRRVGTVASLTELYRKATPWSYRA